MDRFRPQPLKTKPQARPGWLLSGTVAFMAFLLVLSGVLDGDSETEDRSGISLPGEGGGGAGTLVPGAPLQNLPGGSPVPDGPGTGIIQDVRETLYRLPLDRNNPETYDPPVRRIRHAPS